MKWVDARLTDKGVAQAEVAHGAWEKQIKSKIPFPESYYVSPLNRCLATASITFKGLNIPHTDPFRPTIKEVRSYPHLIQRTMILDKNDIG